VRVGHAQRTGDALAQEGIERLAGDPLDHAPEDVRRVAVHEPVARLCRERQGGQPLHRRTDRLVLVGGVPAPPGGGPQSAGRVERRDEGIGAVRDAGGVGEQVTNGDAPPSRQDHPPGIASRCHRRPFIGGDVPAHRIAKRDPSLFHERHDADARQRLGLRGDAKEIVGTHATHRFAVGPSDGPLIDRLSVPQYEGDRAGDLA
jgi:hypothetical protein